MVLVEPKASPGATLALSAEEPSLMKDVEQREKRGPRSLRGAACAAVFVGIAMLPSGCGPSRESALAAAASIEHQLRARASFDMQCPERSLEITPIKQHAHAFHEDVPYLVVAGVRGCDQQATYVFNEYQAVWILNTDSLPGK